MGLFLEWFGVYFYGEYVLFFFELIRKVKVFLKERVRVWSVLFRVFDRLVGFLSVCLFFDFG